MINTDKEWRNLVRNIANASTYSRDNILAAAGYLWDSHNWERLKETWHGKFLREVHNDCPDPMLRILYRTEVLNMKVEK